jgi:hypothetical protein
MLWITEANRRSTLAQLVFIVRFYDQPDATLYADSYEDAAIKYCETYSFKGQGQVTVEGDDYFVTFEVEEINGQSVVSEIDREQK